MNDVICVTYRWELIGMMVLILLFNKANLSYHKHLTFCEQLFINALKCSNANFVCQKGGFSKIQ